MKKDITTTFYKTNVWDLIMVTDDPRDMMVRITLRIPLFKFDIYKERGKEIEEFLISYKAKKIKNQEVVLLDW